MLFKYYKDTHVEINPLTVTFEEFIKNIPTEVFYSKDKGGIQHVAFLKENEITYVSSRDEITFEDFALAVVEELFATNQTIFFEADDVDWAVTAVKNLFLTESTETFDTWVYKD